jgi:hypothetical protein
MPPNPAALDQLRSALANVDTQVHRAIEAANCCDLVGVREEVERLTPPLAAAGRIIQQLDRANSHTFFTLPAVMSTLNLPLLSSSRKCLRSVFSSILSCSALSA